MKFADSLKENPIVKMRTAIDILSHETVMQNGIDYGDTYYSCLNKYALLIRKTIINNKELTKEYKHSYVGETPELLIEVDKNQRGISLTNSTVNFEELLLLYNNELTKHGNETIVIYGFNDKVNITAGNDEISKESLTGLVKAIAQVVEHTVCREDDKLINESFDAIFNEYTKDITEIKLQGFLSAAKDSLKEMFPEAITKGRPAKVIDKKIYAGIYLADKFKGEVYCDKDIPRMYDALKGIRLSKYDKRHVVRIFSECKKP